MSLILACVFAFETRRERDLHRHMSVHFPPVTISPSLYDSVPQEERKAHLINGNEQTRGAMFGSTVQLDKPFRLAHLGGRQHLPESVSCVTRVVTLLPG